MSRKIKKVVCRGLETYLEGEGTRRFCHPGMVFSAEDCS
jgi:hypothetical protein